MSTNQAIEGGAACPHDAFPAAKVDQRVGDNAFHLDCDPFGHGFFRQASARRKRRPYSAERAAFSLIEVVIAVGVFALAIVVILGLLPALTRSAAEASDALVAQNFPDPLRIELMRLVASGGFDALAGRLPEMSVPLADGLALVAAHEGRSVQTVDFLPPPSAGQLPEADRYFLIEVWRFDQPPLRYDPAAAMLPAYVRVSWPYRLPGAADPTPLEARSQITFTVSLHR
jgi:hypothetical protein